MNPLNSAISMKYEKNFFFFISCYLKPLTHFIFSHNDIYQDIHFMHILRGINEVAQNEKKILWFLYSKKMANSLERLTWSFNQA